MALKEADWEQLLPRLTAYAEQRLRHVGWAQGRHMEPSRVSTMDLVNTALERCLDGRRRWDDEAPPELGAFLCGVIRSLSSDEKKMFRRDKVEFDSVAVDAAGDTRINDDGEMDGMDEGMDEASIIADAVEACATGDAELESFYLAVLDGNTKREDIASALGWLPGEVTAARIKLQRRLLKRFPKEFTSAKQRRRSS